MKFYKQYKLNGTTVIDCRDIAFHFGLFCFVHYYYYYYYYYVLILKSTQAQEKPG